MTASRDVLVIDGDGRQLAWLARIVRTVVTAPQLAEHLADDQDTSQLALIVASYDGLAPAERERLFERIDGAGASPRLLLLSSADHDPRQLFLELERHGLTNLLAHDGEMAPRDLIVTIQKLLRDEVFGLDKYFGWGVEPFRTRIRGSADIVPAVEAASAFAADLEVHPRLVDNVATVVDELITNALYNAPVDAAGQHRFAHLPRTAPVQLEPDEVVELTLCCDGETLGMSVSDSFGAITKEQAIDYLAKCMRREVDPPPGNKGGAGLGLFMTFSALNHLILNIAPGEKTEVIGLIDVRGSYKNFVNRGKSFNIFLDGRAHQ